MIKKPLILLTLVCLVLFSSCHLTTHSVEPSKITSINILDQNGVSQTISSKSRLAEYEQTDFLAPQPYQKVMRVYGREKNGDIHAQITSYHPNGQLKQYLEAVNNRAFGVYCEWHPNGQTKVQAKVISGVADLNSGAEESWLFDGPTWAWDDEGHFLAEIVYDRGVLEGMSRYYHPSGMLWKQSPYYKGVLHGEEAIYCETGDLLQTVQYEMGEKQGAAYRYWDYQTLASEEHFVKDHLMKGVYYTQSGNIISQIEEGNGKRAVFGREVLAQLQEFQDGQQAGLVECFDNGGRVVNTYHLKEGAKQGEEVIYHPQTTLPKLLLTWKKGLLHGPVKSWYEEGTLESQREMSENQKNGLLTSWYQNGTLMLVEEYEKDKLIKGEYYRIGESFPSSKIEHGNGIATLFSGEGTFMKKVHYQDGKPVL